MKVEDFIIYTRQTLKAAFEEVDTWFLKDSVVRQYQPRNGGWSINRILEHIEITNHYLLILIEKGARKALQKAKETGFYGTTEEYTPDQQRLEEIGKHKYFEWIRPEHMEPKGEKPLEEVRQQLKDQVNQCLEVLDRLSKGEGMLSKTTMSVNQLGKIDVYQYIFFLAQHAKRHITQMQNVEREYLATFA